MDYELEHDMTDLNKRPKKMNMSGGVETDKHLVDGWSYDLAIKDMEAKAAKWGIE